MLTTDITTASAGLLLLLLRMVMVMMMMDDGHLDWGPASVTYQSVDIAMLFLYLLTMVYKNKLNYALVENIKPRNTHEAYRTVDSKEEACKRHGQSP